MKRSYMLFLCCGMLVNLGGCGSAKANTDEDNQIVSIEYSVEEEELPEAVNINLDNFKDFRVETDKYTVTLEELEYNEGDGLRYTLNIHNTGSKKMVEAIFTDGEIDGYEFPVTGGMYEAAYGQQSETIGYFLPEYVSEDTSIFDWHKGIDVNLLVYPDLEKFPIHIESDIIEYAMKNGKLTR